jgi:phenylalanine-4-hydroxylase
MITFMSSQKDLIVPIDPLNLENYQPERPDWTIDQGWERYTEQEHATWRVLYQRMTKLMKGRACKLFEQGIKELPMDSEQIPNFIALSERLQKHSGWTVVAVPGLVPDNIFFEHLANRRFPSGCYIRRPHEMDYQEYPDVFHDIFGHIPLLMYPLMGDFIQSCGQAAVKAHHLKQADVIERIARLYWYIVEVGLVQEEDGIRSYGAAIASSEKEILFSLESDSPNLVMFDVERVMRSEFWIYDLQQTYFVIKDMNELLTIAQLNLEAITKKLNGTPDIELGDLVAEDHVIQYGTLRYHEKKQLQASAA